MREKGLVVNGFLFSSNKDYTQAKEEFEAIEYLKTNTDLSKPRTILKLYNKLIENNTFQTPIGYTFLKELQHDIIKSELVKPEDIEEIYIPNLMKMSGDNEYEKLSIEHYKQLAHKEHIKNRNSKIVNVFLIITIIVMIVMALYSDKTLFNEYKNNIINQYAAWEEDLKNWDEELKSWEEDLEKRETLLNDKQ
jgi:hypothetical protein